MTNLTWKKRIDAKTGENRETIEFKFTEILGNRGTLNIIKDSDSCIPDIINNSDGCGNRDGLDGKLFQGRPQSPERNSGYFLYNLLHLPFPTLVNGNSTLHTFRPKTGRRSFSHDPHPINFDPHSYCLSWSLNFGKRQARHRDRFNSLPDIRVLSGHWTVALQVKIGLSRPVFLGTSGRTRSSPCGFSPRVRNPAPLSCNLQRSSAGDRVFNWRGVLQAQVRVCGDVRGESAVPAGSSNVPGQFELRRRQGRRDR
uniref:uncharacterized protein LOC114677347 n=1 Tax=Macaca mulatta TaxID=9544 RepID=UPI0010A1FD1E|nr:uncharacterized protein LOC114677347 [Macaca mulatta]